MLGVVRAADGWVGINCLTGQHWLDVCAMLGLPEYGEHQIAIMLGGPERAEFFAKAEPLLASQTVAEIVELGQALRIPAAPVNDGASVLDCPQYAERGFFVTAAETVGRSNAPGRRSGSRKPRSHNHVRRRAWERRPRRGPPAANRLRRPTGSLPFAGLRVLDLTTFWAGAYLTCYLGAFGADIVKVESIQRPDGHRYSGAFRLRGRRLVRAQRPLAGHQPQQARPHARPDLAGGTRHRPAARRAGRRCRGELFAASGRAVRPGLRLAGIAEA